MDPLRVNRTRKTGPEAIIQKAIIDRLKMADWYVIVTHGNEFQSGLPDLYCAHAKWGARWIEVKNPLSYKFTTAQLEVFPSLSAKGIGVWVLTAATDFEMEKLFLPPNWYWYLPSK